MNIIEKRWQELENKVAAEMRETIGDEKKATALAGIMGGKNSGIQENTTDIFIESAYFDAPIINKTSKK